MQKSIRSFALIAALTVAAVPAVRADQTGCNPHPQVVTASTFSILVSTVIAYLGA